jgi:hypothetical protein
MNSNEKENDTPLLPMVCGLRSKQVFIEPFRNILRFGLIFSLKERIVPKSGKSNPENPVF